MAKNIRVGITHGDFNGIGYEVILKALAEEGITDLFTPVVFADWRLIDHARKSLNIEIQGLQRVSNASEARDGAINIVDLRLADTTLEPGKPTKASGQGAIIALEKAVEAVEAGDIDVIVTAPINKAAVQSDSFHFPGHTEYLEAKAGNDFHAQMILFDDRMRVALVTTHLPVSKISEAITKEKVVDAITRLNATLRQDFGCDGPKIAVLSLNPHCGDDGLLGSEEQDVIIPAIEEANQRKCLAFGPYAADGFFGSGAYADFDGIVAMYHDQGLAPFKALSGDDGVNFTAGLPFVRTSPDHGTAYDIAWQGVADPASMRTAIYKAIDIVRTRRNHQHASRNPLRKARADKPADNRNDKTIDLSKEEL